MNNGQMDRDNENPTQHLPWWLRKTTKKTQSGWSAPGFEPGASRMRVSCVTTEPPRSILLFLLLSYVIKSADRPLRKCCNQSSENHSKGLEIKLSKIRLWDSALNATIMCRVPIAFTTFNVKYLNLTRFVRALARKAKGPGLNRGLG